MQKPLEERVPLFSDRALARLIIPLIVERFLDMSVGIFDSVMVAYVGEAAVSGTSLVDNISNLVIFLLAALSTGGAVVISQYIGREDVSNARAAAKQLFYVTVAFSILIMAVCLIFRDGLLRMIFGSPEADVMYNASQYFWPIALSYPFIGIFNVVASLYRSMGNSRVSMMASLIMNLLNIGGNALFIYGLEMGSMGAALSSLISRILAAACMLYLIRDHRNLVFLDKILSLELRPKMVKSILKIGIPNGLENGMFHIGKLFVQGLVTTFGTAAIAANAVAMRVVGLSQVAGSAISMTIITVVGQCIGARDYKQAGHYTKMLMLFAYGAMLIPCAIMFLLSEQALTIFKLSPDALRTGAYLLRISAVFSVLFWPPAFPFPNTLRAAGDAKFTMLASIISMWTVRVGMSYVFHYVFDLGLVSAWYAMFADWMVRSVLFVIRYLSGKWRTKSVID